MNIIYLHITVAIFVLILVLRLYCQYKAKQLTKEKEVIEKLNVNPLAIVNTKGIENIDLVKQIKIMNALTISMRSLFFILVIMVIIFKAKNGTL